MNIVISGTSSGIGKAAALKFLKEGHTVSGIDRLPSAIDHPYYRHWICDIRNFSRSARISAGNGTTAVPEEEDPAVRSCGILINCAGTQDESEAVDVNLVGTMRFTEQFLDSPSLRSVLFIASASARNGSEFPCYSASKAGLVGYMKNLALTLSKRGILCNSISPGGVITPANQHILDSPSLYAAVKAETLLGKWAMPEEIADLAYYLTVVNRSMTGEDLLVDNGEMLKSNFIW